MPINYRARFKMTYLDLGNFIGNLYIRKVSPIESQLSLLGWMTMG